MSERDELNMRVSAMRAIEAVISEFPDTGNPIKRYVDFLAGERMRLWEAQRYAATPAPSAPEPLLTRGAAAVSNAAVPAGDGRKKLIEAILDEVLDESDDTLSVGAFDEIVDRLSALPAAAPSAPVDGWVMAPREPTPAMSAAGFCVSEAEHDPAGVYRAMLAAAPTGPAARQPSGEAVAKVTVVSGRVVGEHRIELSPDFDEKLNMLPHGTTVPLYTLDAAQADSAATGEAL